MDLLPKPKGLTNDDFDLRINPIKNNQYTIEWTSKKGGVVRAKANNNTDFIYASSSIKGALVAGEYIVDYQRKTSYPY